MLMQHAGADVGVSCPQFANGGDRDCSSACCMKALSRELRGNLWVGQPGFGELIDPRKQLRIVTGIRLPMDGRSDPFHREMSADPDNFDFDAIKSQPGRNDAANEGAQQPLFVGITNLSGFPQSWQCWANLLQLLAQLWRKLRRCWAMFKALSLFFGLTQSHELFFPPFLQ